MKKQSFIVALVLYTSTTLGFATPAQDLFSQATDKLQKYYYGFSSITNLAAEINLQQQALNTECKTKQEQCSYETARVYIRKIVESLNDSHTQFLDPQANIESDRRSAGLASSQPRPGFRWSHEINTTFIRVIRIQEDSPATEAGLRRGDHITAINGIAIPSTTQNDIIDFLLQYYQSKQSLKLSVERRTSLLEINLTPRVIPLALPRLYAAPGVADIGVLDIYNFSALDIIGPMIHQLVREAQQRQFRALVIDLRSNGGGYLTECLAGVGAFTGSAGTYLQSLSSKTFYAFEKGQVFERIVASGEQEVYSTIENPVVWGKPVVILVDRETASCAETFAYEIESHKVGKVIGETTFGLLNTTTNKLVLADSSALVIPMWRKVDVNGAVLPDRIQPDITVTENLDELAATGKDSLFEKALEELNALPH
jgi:carboxyl-terminal processing protease